jgi:hypothetical protein
VSEVTDPDGTTAIVSTAPANSGTARRSLSAEPTLVIGEATDDPDLLVAQVMGAVRLPDGGVVVADQETRLRWFSADGGLRFEAGGKGQGPGEFEFIFRLERCGIDTLHVAAPGDQVSVYSLEGEYLEKIVWDFPVDQHQTACDREGNVVATGWGPFPEALPADGTARLDDSPKRRSGVVRRAVRTVRGTSLVSARSDATPVGPHDPRGGR